VDEYYSWIFDNSVPGLPETAKKEGLTPLQYMRKYGAFEVTRDVYKQNEKPVAAADLAGSKVEANGVVTKEGKAVGVMVEDKAVVGYRTPSRKLELFSKTMADWKWPEFPLPEYYRSHIHRSAQAASLGQSAEDFDAKYMPVVEWPKEAHGEVYTLLPIFRLPNLIHTRSGNAKFLYEISHKNPLWVNPVDAGKLGGVRTGDLMKVHTEIGYFVLHAWITEGLTPGVVACSHHLGRWRINKEDQVERMSSAWVDLKEVGKGQWKMRQIESVSPYESADPETKRVWWSDAGVHQDITFPVHPDPISGMHCWHQMVRVEKAGPDDRYGDIFVDTNLSFAVYQRWKALTRPAPGPCGLRRPLWIPRVVRPEEAAFYIKKP
jgi:anaerobic selenocysteine-containing dehydrogenase